LNKVANNYWVDRRLGSQRVGVRTLPRLPQVPDLSRGLSGAVAKVAARKPVFPAGAFFGMVLLATLGGVRYGDDTFARRNIKTRCNISKPKCGVTDLVRGNAALKQEVNHLRNDPGVIESSGPGAAQYGKA